jgi:hypothetical protein
VGGKHDPWLRGGERTATATGGCRGRDGELFLSVLFYRSKRWRFLILLYRFDREKRLDAPRNNHHMRNQGS